MEAACKFYVMIAVTVGTILLSLPQADANGLVAHASSLAVLLYLIYYCSFCMVKMVGLLVDYVLGAPVHR